MKFYLDIKSTRSVVYLVNSGTTAKDNDSRNSHNDNHPLNNQLNDQDISQNNDH